MEGGRGGEEYDAVQKLRETQRGGTERRLYEKAKEGHDYRSRTSPDPSLSWMLKPAYRISHARQVSRNSTHILYPNRTPSAR